MSDNSGWLLKLGFELFMAFDDFIWKNFYLWLKTVDTDLLCMNYGLKEFRFRKGLL